MIGWVPIEKYNIKVEEPTNQNSLWFFVYKVNIIYNLNKIVNDYSY